MKMEIHCPEQPDHFDVARCVSCRYFQLTKTGRVSVVCRKNNKKPYKTHFESVYFSTMIGHPDEAVIVPEGGD